MPDGGPFFTLGAADWLWETQHASFLGPLPGLPLSLALKGRLEALVLKVTSPYLLPAQPSYMPEGAVASPGEACGCSSTQSKASVAPTSRTLASRWLQSSSPSLLPAPADVTLKNKHTHWNSGIVDIKLAWTGPRMPALFIVYFSLISVTLNLGMGQPKQCLQLGEVYIAWKVKFWNIYLTGRKR